MKDKGFARKIAIRALLYMLSTSSSESSRVGVSAMVGWTGCSKPTVLKELKKLEELGLVIKTETSHRTNRTAFYYYVPDTALKTYHMTASMHSYSTYKINILGIAE